MKTLKMIIFGLAMMVYSYVSVSLYHTPDAKEIYSGIPYGGILYVYMIHLLFLGCYMFYVYTDIEEYLYQYGVYMVTREQSRKKLFLRLTKKIFWKALQLECMLWAGYFIITMLEYGKVQIPDFHVFLTRIILHFLCVYTLLFVQMLLEIFLSGKIALISILSGYLSLVCLSDLLHKCEIKVKYIELLLFPNLLMQSRLYKILPQNQMDCFVILFVLFCDIILYWIGRKLFFKKDII